MTATATSPLDQVRALAAEQLERDSWSREKLLDHQAQRLCRLLAHAVVRSPYYLEALGPDAAGKPLRSLPTLSKATLMEQWDRIVCDPRLRLADVEAHATGPHAAEPLHGEFQVFSTSGASGLRGLFAYNSRDWAVGLAETMRAMVRAGARPGERVIGVGAPPGVHMSPRIFAALQAGADARAPLSALTPLDEIVAALNLYQPVSLLGYPSIASLLAGEQLAGRLAIAPRQCALGSEPLTAAAREHVQAAWGIDPVEYYASTEIPLLGASTAEHPRAVELFEDLAVIEVVDEDDQPVPPGTPGSKVLLTNLESYTLPLIRYELADRVTVSPDPNPAGRPYRHLTAIEGRTADTMTFPARGGGEVAVLPLRLGAPFARIAAVRQFQIVQTADRLTVRVVLEPLAPPATTTEVRDAVGRALDEAGAVLPDIDIVPVDRLEREPGAAAKLKLVVAQRGTP
jgi:phenylacetate-coenzyme A ligase PaaK-like adenylate-forming protein